jgi:hypothetical protein
VPELLEWSVVVDGEVIEVLAEQRRVGEVIYLDDIAVYPASGSSIAVGAAAVLRIARREFPKQFCRQRSIGTDHDLTPLVPPGHRSDDREPRSWVRTKLLGEAVGRC